MKKLQVTSYKLRVTSYKRFTSHLKSLTSYLIPLIAFCFLPFALFAQHKPMQPKPAQNKPTHNKPMVDLNESRAVYFGLLFGPTIDWLSPTTNQIERKTATGGVIAGALVEPSLVKERFLYFSTGVVVRYLQGKVTFDNEYTLNDSSRTINALRHYETAYLTLPTGVKFKTNPVKNCVFTGVTGLYHNFKITGKQFDSFKLDDDEEYDISTHKKNNTNVALFAESVYAGLGFEYVIGKSRAFANLEYSCQFNYFNKDAKSSISEERFRGIVHSMHIVFGFLF